jgi:hypothetical protein
MQNESMDRVRWWAAGIVAYAYGLAIVFFALGAPG